MDRRKLGIAGLLALLLALGTWLAWPRPSTGASDAVATVRAGGTDARVVKRLGSGGTPSSVSSGDEVGCPERRARLQAALDASCEADRLSRGCRPPLRFPSGVGPYPALLEAVDTVVADCVGVEPADVVLDCTAWPCIPFVPPGPAAALAACTGVEHEGFPEPPPHPVFTRWTPLAPVLRGRQYQEAETLEKVEATWNQRLNRVAPWLDRIPGTRSGLTRLDRVVDAPACSDVERLLADLPPCAEVASCMPDALTLSGDEVTAYLDGVDAALDALAEECEGFAQASWFLDCEQLPCVLGIRSAEMEGGKGSPRDHLLCDASFNDGVRARKTYVSVGTGAERISLVPLLDLGGDTPVEILEERWRRDKEDIAMHAFELVSDPLGARRASGDLPVP